PGLEALEHMGEKSFLSTLAAWLAEALYEQGRDDEAAALTQASEAAAAPDDVVSQVGWRFVRAKLLARRGASGEGERLAREAVALAELTDMPDLRGDALWALAEVLDEPAEAASALEQAAATFEQKGNEVSAARARAARDELQEVSGS
ncbi:MAG: adenylate/guanylate cyclase domain-containing protein, partial [Gaiellaceae bacterium]